MQGYPYKCANCGHVNPSPTSSNALNNESSATSANLSTPQSKSNMVHSRGGDLTLHPCTLPVWASPSVRPTTTTTSTDAGIRIGTHTSTTVTTHTGPGTLEPPQMSRPQLLQMSSPMGPGHEIITGDAHTEAHPEPHPEAHPEAQSHTLTHTHTHTGTGAHPPRDTALHHGGAHIAQSGGIGTTTVPAAPTPSLTTQSSEETPVIPQHPASQKTARTSTARAVAQINAKLEQRGQEPIVRDIPDLSKFKNVHRVWEVHAPCHMHVHAMLCFFHPCQERATRLVMLNPQLGMLGVRTRTSRSQFRTPIPRRHVPSKVERRNSCVTPEVLSAEEDT